MMDNDCKRRLALAAMLPVSLYLTNAEKEIAEGPAFFEGIKFLGGILKKRDYRGFMYEFRILDDTYHVSSKPEGYTRGMQFIFAPLVGQNDKHSVH
jgi:hypothetical protein